MSEHLSSDEQTALSRLYRGQPLLRIHLAHLGILADRGIIERTSWGGVGGGFRIPWNGVADKAIKGYKL